MNKQLGALGIPETPEMRRQYRQLLFTTPGIEEYVTGVIVHDGTIRNHTDDGVQFSDVLISKGIVPIIKVDTGTVPHTNFPGELLTQGLDDLEKRLREYYDMGARAAKWRAVVTISDTTPTLENLRSSAFLMARYAALCQLVGIVPMVEPEVLYSGSHDIGRAEGVTTEALKILFEALYDQRVELSGVILKSSMVLAGSEYHEQSAPSQVAEASMRTYRNAVPEEVPGIVFLSGGQTPERATENLNAIAQREESDGPFPWQFAFSFSRGLEEPVQRAWLGQAANVPMAQAELQKRLRLNSLADAGEYTASME